MEALWGLNCAMESKIKSMIVAEKKENGNGCATKSFESIHTNWHRIGRKCYDEDLEVRHWGFWFLLFFFWVSSYFSTHRLLVGARLPGLLQRSLLYRVDQRTLHTRWPANASLGKRILPKRLLACYIGPIWGHPQIFCWDGKYNFICITLCLLHQNI